MLEGATVLFIIHPLLTRRYVLLLAGSSVAESGGGGAAASGCTLADPDRLLVGVMGDGGATARHADVHHEPAGSERWH